MTGYDLVRRFIQRKLWRDGAIDLVEMDGSRVYWRCLSDEEFDRSLKEKLLEEALEVRSARDRDELLEEMADVLTVLDALMELNQISLSQLLNAKNKKNDERGDFSGRKYVEYSDHPHGSRGERYCLNDPDKYTEILISE